ncbi:calcium-binding protein P-like [Pectinophora gossypiella]|uniref:calcium-binding protein P-like n=1 Tax=Pectinophora gossypiella TaxID=13191 RepID=UPI00214F267C|nr:calcium-binding protein P-like [Pectinophora gossypiella]
MAGQGAGPAQQGMPGQDTGASFGPSSDDAFKSLDATKQPDFYQPGALGAPRQSVGKQGAMSGATSGSSPGSAPRQSIAQSGRRPSMQQQNASRKSVQLVDGRRSSAAKSPGRQSVSKQRQDSTPEVWGSMNETKAPVAMWNQEAQQLEQSMPLQMQQQSMPQQMQRQSMPPQMQPSMQQQSAGQPMPPGQPANVGAPGQPPPNQDGSMWLDQYMTQYQAKYPPIPAVEVKLQDQVHLQVELANLLDQGHLQVELANLPDQGHLQVELTNIPDQDHLEVVKLPDQGHL